MPVTSSISSRVECSFMEIIMVASFLSFGPFGFGLLCVTRRCLCGPKNKKAHSVRVGQKSCDALELDAGRSHPDVAVRKSPRVAIQRERHEEEFTGIEGKGKGGVPESAWRVNSGPSKLGPYIDAG